MKRSLDELCDALEGQNSPRDLCGIKTSLALLYAEYSGILENCLIEKAEKWEDFRKDATSDTQAERKWERTEEGMGETVTKLRMKKIEKLLSAVSSKIQVAEMEAKNMC